VELVNATHLLKLPFDKRIANDTARLIQDLIFSNYLAILENQLSSIFPSTNSYCFVATEKNKVIGFLTIKPVNRRGTCWSINQPIILELSEYHSSNEIKSILIRESFKQISGKALNWVIRCEAADTSGISVVREMGFQPLALYKHWSFVIEKKEIERIKEDESLPSYTSWQSLTKRNALELFKLEQVSESVLMRKIYDRQPSDLFQSSNANSGILITNENNDYSSIAGLINVSTSLSSSCLRIVRDVAWDNRISKALPILLPRLNSVSEGFIVETQSQDVKLNNLLQEIGLEEDSETLLLGKTLLNRNKINNISSTKLSFDSMLKGLEQTQSPQPSPSLIPR